MAYTTNPKMPRLRAKAVDMVKLEGKSIRQVARYLGYNPSTISRWVKKSHKNGNWKIDTLSSRPHNHPKQLKQDIIDKIIYFRKSTGGRCAEVVHKHMINHGYKVSLSSVKRTLDRQGFTKKKSKWKRLRKNTHRPHITQPGDLVQIDTIHIMKSPKERFYIYTLLDVHSRWAFAQYSEKISAGNTLKFVHNAKKHAPFQFHFLQSDNGPEFSSHFTDRIKIQHRHSRVRKPNDNAHLERFNRTIQDELINKIPLNTSIIQKEIPKYIHHYNNKRLHLAINLLSPLQFIQNCCKAID